MVDYREAQYRLPHRKPISIQPTADISHLKPLTQIVPDGRQPSVVPQASAAHNRSRTASSSVFPGVIPSPTSSSAIPPPLYQHTTPPYNRPSRRSPSNATASSSNTGTGAGVHPARSSSNSFSLRRSTSSRSGAAATGYVALMRRQKATVWCDRSQHEDPRLMAQQKAARLRAAREVDGPPSRTSTGASGSLTAMNMGKKTFRHPGKVVTVGYTPTSLVGGVPMRLSASEVGDEGNGEDDADSQYVMDVHRRTASGRSSLGSNRRNNVDGRLSNPNSTPHAAASSRFSEGNTPSSRGSRGSEGFLDDGATPMPYHPHQHYPPQPNQHRPGVGYFVQEGGTGISGGSGGSSSAAERENSFGDVGDIPPPPAASTSAMTNKPGGAMVREKSYYRTPDELRRRGSVDDRTMTMGGGRLFVANPDLSD